MPAMTLQGDELKRVADVCLKNTYAFAKFVCAFYDLDPEVHGPMAAWVQRPTRFKLGQAPRGFLKTSLWTIADKLRRVTADPNLRVLLCNETQENSSKWIGLMQEIIQGEYYRALYPDRVPNPLKVPWNSTALQLRRDAKWPEATIEGIGVGGASTSRHYNVIVNDDLVGKEARESPSVMAKAIDQRKLCWSLMIDASKSEVHDFGTRWAPQDVIDWIQKNVSDIDHHFVPIRNDNGIPRWPTRYPEEIILQLRKEQGAEMYALQYENRVIGDGASRFDSRLLRHWTMETQTIDQEEKDFFVLEAPTGTKRIARDDCLGFQVIDAGLSPESPDARTANLTAFLTPPTPTEPFDIVIAEAKATKSTPYQVVEEAEKSYRRWDPLFAAIETYGGHQAFFGWLVSAYPNMRIMELKKDFSRNAKHKRINGFWGSYPSQGRIYIHRHHTDLVDELDAYPNGRTVDLLDAAGYLPTVWSPPDPVDAQGKKIRKPNPDFPRYRRPEMNEDAEAAVADLTRSAITGY